LNDHVAGAAGAGSTACPLHLEIVGLSNVEEVVSVSDFKMMFLAFLVDEGYMALLPGFGRGELAVELRSGG